MEDGDFRVELDGAVAEIAVVVAALPNLFLLLDGIEIGADVVEVDFEGMELDEEGVECAEGVAEPKVVFDVDDGAEVELDTELAVEGLAMTVMAPPVVDLSTKGF